ncbi:putative peptidase Do [Helianthus anomalus]
MISLFFLFSVIELMYISFRVTLADQTTYDAKVVGFDQDKDVAVLSIDAPKDKLRPIPVGVSADLLVGQKVFAIGNPVSVHILTLMHENMSILYMYIVHILIFFFHF